MARHNKISPGRKTPKKVIYLACEGGSTGTEGTYIKDLCNKYNCALLSIYKGSVDPVKLANIAVDFASRTPKRPKENFEIWIVFDNDDPKAVKAAFARVDGYNRMPPKNCVPVNIAFNAPCVEVWGLLCCGEKPKQTSTAVMQSALSVKMPAYHHKKSPRFDFDRTEAGCTDALALARSWNLSLAGAAEHTAHLYAGIYKLVESIKE